MKIGITIATKNRQGIVSQAILQHYKHSQFDKLVIVDDHSEVPVYNPLPPAMTAKMQIVRPPEWLGVAGARNYGLSLIDDCDYMFVLDDDCYPKSNHWVEAYLRVFRNNPSIHMLGGMPNKWAEVTNHYGQFVTTKGSTGVLFALDQIGLSKIGGFDGFGAKYGFDDADYFHRAHAAGISPYGLYTTISDFEFYFHVCDIDGGFNGATWAGQSALGEVKNKHIAAAGPRYFNRDKSVIHKPYK